MIAVYRIYNKISKRELGIAYTENMEKMMEEFHSGKLPESFVRMKNPHFYDIQILEKNPKSLSESYARFKYPQLSRVEYDPLVIEKSIEPGFPKSVTNAVSWLVEAFPLKTYSFYISVNDNNKIVGKVMLDNEFFEMYVFTKRGKPYTRIVKVD